MFCKSCGAEMDDNCRKCSQCGNDPNVDYGHTVKRENSAQYGNESFQSSFAGRKTKSKWIAGILQLLFPQFALGRLYLGNYGKAMAQIMVGFLFLVRVPFTFRIISLGYLWAIYDGICILLGKVKTDAFGNEVK